MKKFFLIPLLTLVCSVMAWATDAHVSTIADLNAKLADASVETIYLDADLTYTTENCINILRSVTIDGQGHKISGGGIRTGSTKSTMAINQGAPGNGNWIDLVTLKNITLQTSTFNQVLNCRGNITRLVIENSTIKSTYASGNNQSITFANASQSSSIELVINNSIIDAGNSGYPIITWNPLAIEANGSTFSGYCGLYFKAPNGTPGSRGSVVNADACDFNAPNVHAYAGGWNNFGVFTMEDQNITINLHNCGMNSEETGFAKQGMILAEMPSCIVNISGDNSHINGKMVLADDDDPGYWLAFLLLTEGNISITGGTYSVDPSHFGPYNPFTSFGDQEPTLPNEDFYANFVPSTHEVQEVKQGSVTLYRVVKKAEEKAPGVLYDLNDDVPTDVAGEGINPATSFELSTGGTMELDEDREVTKAGYVQVKDNEDTGNATVVKVGTTETADPTQKVDQTLLINNGLDVQGESQVIVQAGSTLQIGEGGINTEKPENIIIEADENGAASLLLDPTITINQTPNLTVRMTAKQIGRNADNDYFWHRFAMPVASITSWDKEGALGEGNDKYPTYLYAWDYANNDWANIAPNAMEPLQGYTLTLASEYIDGAAADGHLNVLQDVVYTFKGNLVGNTDQPLNFQHEGFNFFGNSYTGYMDVKTMLQGLEDGHIDGTAYMWNTDEQIYVGVSLLKLIKGRGLDNWQKEVAPMQTFILRLRGADTANEEVNYAAAIWGNPNRYGNNGGSSPAPRRRVADINEDTYMEIAVKAANGKTSRVDFTESANNSDAFESGYDVEKYMNEKTINLYASVNGMNLSSVVTDNIEGKTLSLQTNEEIAYTMSFKNVEGTEYAIRDNATNQVIAIEEGATYEFAAQPNSVIEGRFEIIDRANAPTAIENTQVKANVKGIYTIMGQYLGEDFDILPAGVYVVDGVKIVK